MRKVGHVGLPDNVDFLDGHRACLGLIEGYLCFCCVHRACCLGRLGDAMAGCPLLPFRTWQNQKVLLLHCTGRAMVPRQEPRAGVDPDELVEVMLRPQGLLALGEYLGAPPVRRAGRAWQRA